MPVEAQPGASPSAAPSADASPTPIPVYSTEPSGGPASPTPDPADRVATRVVVTALHIDLPVISQPNPSYPSCDVAMYLEDERLGQPGQGKATYIYAHAQKGMFL